MVGMARGSSAGDPKSQSAASQSSRSRSHSNLKELERLRLKAARMFEAGATQADVHRKLGVSRESASRWHRLWKQGGKDALRTKQRAGRPRKLGKEELKEIEKALLQGAEAHGFDTDLWTLERVGKVIEDRTGIAYHPSGVWHVLKRLGWSLQRPARRAKERDNRSVRRWVKKCWPGIVARARRRRAWLVFQDESGISLTPPVRRTWAPRGKAPVMTHPFNWKRASMPAALCYSHDGRRAQVVFQIRPGHYNDAAVIEFLKQLHRQLRGERITLLWDGLSSHRSRRMRAYLGTHRRWLMVERLPAYAPELNPVGSFWGHLKGTRLAGLLADTLDVAIDAAKRGVVSIRRKRTLLYPFLQHSGLSRSQCMSELFKTSFNPKNGARRQSRDGSMADSEDDRMADVFVQAPDDRGSAKKAPPRSVCRSDCHALIAPQCH